MSVEAFEARVAGATTPASLWHLLTGFFKDTDVERVIYHHLPPMGAPDADVVSISAHGVPDDLVRTYIDQKLYRGNSMLQHALRNVEPFYLDTLEFPEELTGAQGRFLQEWRRLDFLRGLGVQVFGPHGRNGYFGLGFRQGFTRLDQSDVHSYQWVCQLTHLRYCLLLMPTLGPPPQLSERETEVLGWVARGKSNTSIAEILGISTHTVDAHLRRVYLKLGVFDRISAALRGIGIGLIQTTP
jgi:LuxR family transcriptional regulator/LuxR family quorum-sensing system transcriptional regulator CciR